MNTTAEKEKVSTYAQNNVQPTNKIFELVDYLYSRIDDIETKYSKVIPNLNIKRRELNELRKKTTHPLSDKTTYNRKKEEFESHYKKLEPIFQTFKDKFTELGFELRYGTYKNDVKETIYNWYDEFSNTEGAKIYLKDYKKKITRLKSDIVLPFISFVLPAFFINDLFEIMDNEFSNALQSNFEGIATDLQAFFSNTTDDVIESIIEYKMLPSGAEKPIAKRETYAVVFGDSCGIKLKDLSQFFRKEIDGKAIDFVFTKSRPKKETKQTKELKDILSKYI